jgi:4-hydroxyphenylpyruvate dioxygenase-like putative hemolysin
MSDDGPRLLKRKAPVHVTVEGLFKAIQSITNDTDAAKFLEEHGQSTVAVPVGVVNGAKSHLHRSEAHLTSAFAQQVVDSPKPKPGEPQTCFNKPPKPAPSK